MSGFLIGLMVIAYFVVRALSAASRPRTTLPESFESDDSSEETSNEIDDEAEEDKEEELEVGAKEPELRALTRELPLEKERALPEDDASQGRDIEPPADAPPVTSTAVPVMKPLAALRALTPLAAMKARAPLAALPPLDPKPTMNPQSR